MKKTLLAIALMASMAGVSAKTVVTVNGTKIDSAVIDRQVSDLSKQSKGQIKDSPELRERLKQAAVVHTRLSAIRGINYITAQIRLLLARSHKHAMIRIVLLLGLIT